MPPNTKILVLASYMYSDPERATFYSLDRSGDYERVGIVASAGTGKLSKLAGYLKTWWRFRDRMREVNPSLVVFESFRHGLIISLLNRLVGFNYPTVIWNVNIVRPYRGIKRAFARVAFSAVRAIVVYSRHEKKLYQQLFHIPENRIRFKLFSGPYLEDDRYRRLLEETKEGYVVSPGYSGRDFSLLADVARQLPDIRFVVLAYPDSIKGVSFPSNVELHYDLPEVDYCRWIAKASVCFLPIANTLTANGHIAIVQAMSLKTLLYTNSTPGTQDYLENNKNCICFTNGETSRIVQELERIRQDHIACRQIIDYAYEFACKNYSLLNDIGLVQQIAAEVRQQ